MDSSGIKRKDAEAAEKAKLDAVDEDTPLQTECVSIPDKKDALDQSRRMNVAYAMRYYFEQNRLRDHIRFGDGWVYKNKHRS